MMTFSARQARRRDRPASTRFRAMRMPEDSIADIGIIDGAKAENV
jgi:hypothetical protein